MQHTLPHITHGCPAAAEPAQVSAAACVPCTCRMCVAHRPPKFAAPPMWAGSALRGKSTAACRPVHPQTPHVSFHASKGMLRCGLITKAMMGDRTPRERNSKDTAECRVRLQNHNPYANLTTAVFISGILPTSVLYTLCRCRNWQAAQPTTRPGCWPILPCKNLFNHDKLPATPSPPPPPWPPAPPA